MNKKFREAIARMLAHFDNRKWEDLPDKTTNLSTMFYSKAHYLHRADQLFEIRDDGCRLAQVKERGELLDSPWADKADKGDVDAQSRTSGYYCSQQDMIEAHYVQEEKDD